MTLKIDIINGAYSKLRISGLTVDPSSEDVSLAMERLEDMASQWEKRNVCTGYFFEEEPDTASPHNLPREYWYAYKACLAVTLAEDFGKQVSPLLLREAAAGFSFLSARTAKINSVDYPVRHPIGSGNEFVRFRKFYGRTNEAPIECETVNMIIGDIEDFYFDFTAYLLASETVSSYTLTADTGLTVQSESLTSPRIDFRVKAVGGSSNDQFLQIKVVITTSLGRIKTVFKNFILTDADNAS